VRLAWVELRDFRNHALTRIDPVPEGLSVAVGPNGEGKTNLLEGLHFLYALGSPRTSTNGNLVRDGFVTPDGGGKDLFVHFSNIVGEGYRSLQDNQKVEFEEREGKKGPEAANVRPL